MSATKPIAVQSRAAGYVAAAPEPLTAGPPVSHRVLDVNELTSEEIDRWLALRASNPSLDSPCFHPRFLAVVAATHPDTKVIVGEDYSGIVASFLPVQLDKRTCRPAGYPAADFQGPICAPGTDFDIVSAISACHATRYAFDHMLEGIPSFDEWTFDRMESPYLDVSGGLDGYRARASKSGKDKMAEARRLSRQAGRDHGPIRFVADSDDPQLLDEVIALKRRQYAQTGARDYFADPQHRRFLHALLGERDPGFAGLLSAVYAGPRLLAAHFGIRAGGVLHWWFPVYVPQVGRLSPGWILLRSMIDAAPDLKIERIDLGRGMDDYKRRAMTGYQVVGQGAVIPNPLRRWAALGRRRTTAALKSSPLGPALRSAVRRARRLRC